MKSATPKVLIVDDEPHIVDNLVQFFELGGFETRSASGGHAARAILASEPIDVVVSDIRMPDGDGLELLKHCKSLDQSRPIFILITGQADLTPEVAYAAGVEAIVEKPFDEETLVATARALLIPPAERWAKQEQAPPAPYQLRVQLPSFLEASHEHRIAVGRGGLALTFGGGRPRPGSAVDVNIRFDSSPSIALEGRGVCRWVKAGGPEAPENQAGIEVLTLTEAGRVWLLGYLRDNPTLAFIPTLQAPGSGASGA